MEAVIGSSPSRVRRDGTVVHVEFATEEEALALERAFDQAFLAQHDPDAYRRRYAAQHGIAEGTAPID